MDAGSTQQIQITAFTVIYVPLSETSDTMAVVQYSFVQESLAHISKIGEGNQLMRIDNDVKTIIANSSPPNHPRMAIPNLPRIPLLGIKRNLQPKKGEMAKI